MKQIILSESQSRTLAKLIKECGLVQQMPVDKKMNKPYFVDPEKVKVVKKFLDKGFTAHDFEKVGENGFPKKIKIITMNASNGEPLKLMYKDQVKDLLIDKFQKMFLDKIERELFMGQVLDDWLNNSIGVHGTLTKNMLNEISSYEIDAVGEDVNLEPTEKQKEAGNYKMGHISIKGMGITIENPRGSIRKGTDKDGTSWEREMKNHYGYFRNTRGNGKDGDAVDVFIGPHPEDFSTVYVIDQKVDGEFDESKVMLGFYSKEEARAAYLSNYSPDWTGLWKITGVSLRTFKRWLYRARKQRKPFFDYVTIRKQKLEEGRLNEEEYNEIRFVGRLFDEKAAMEVAEELKAKGIYAYNEKNALYIEVERDRLSPAYVDEILEVAKETMREYMETHSDPVDSKEFATSLAEDIDPLDLYNNMRSNPNPTNDGDYELESDGWTTVRNKEGKMNIRNDETGEFLSPKWFDWAGTVVNGVAIVKSPLGYNLIDTNGEILLPDWHEDIIEPYIGHGRDDSYILVDGDHREKIKI